MKKYVVLFLFISSFAGAIADDYNYLTFTKSDGTTVSVKVSNLVLTVDGTSLVAKNDDENVSFTLSDLTKMNFTETATAISEVRSDLSEEPVQIYSADGSLEGEYKSLNEAKANLKKGIYVAKFKSQTIKISVR